MEADISPGGNGTAASKQRRSPRRSPVVIAVCGAKGMGKSSLARLLTNRLLNCCQVSAAPLCNDQAEVGIRVRMHFDKPCQLAFHHLFIFMQLLPFT